MNTEWGKRKERGEIPDIFSFRASLHNSYFIYYISTDSKVSL